MREVLQLRKISLASSGVDNNEGEVDPDYVCPICLVRQREPHSTVHLLRWRSSSCLDPTEAYFSCI